MIVIGVDPGSRSTGIAVVEDLARWGQIPDVLESWTVTCPKGTEIVAPPEEYLRDVNAAIVGAMREHAVELIAIEGISRPKGFAKGKRHSLDPAPLIGAGIVLGAVLGRVWPVPVVRVPPGDNGHRLPLTEYPRQLATAGKGQDRRRHERSAYDVASQGRTFHQLAKAGVRP